MKVGQSFEAVMQDFLRGLPYRLVRWLPGVTDNMERLRQSLATFIALLVATFSSSSFQGRIQESILPRLQSRVESSSHRVNLCTAQRLPSNILAYLRGSNDCLTSTLWSV
ncbi:hypothetical protein BDN67DRAFT_1018062 [Paxillus ammoniavirescens]|nr:hypothetical protein BDN67DRAFT_1018062 [Paxillus ammoniavirescens]